MALVVYNTLTRTKDPFEPITPGKVGMYLCGPTVYKPSHVGHAVGPIIFDAVKRYLVFRGYEVTWVVNITDVDDKLIVEAEAQGTTVKELAERVTSDYLDAMRALHVDSIDLMPKASEHIQDIINICTRLIEKDVAYVSGGDVYFDVTRHEDYGKLSNRDASEQEGHRDLKSGEKRNPGDFALWKAAKQDEPPEVKFDSPWGPGRPGWHIECSAMAMRYLGDTFDIHGGGMDLVFPHHENEIAQSEAATGEPFARIWMHNGLTRINTKKISKSDPEMKAMLAGMTLHVLLSQHAPEVIRFVVLSTHYRSPIEWGDAELAAKRKALDSFHRLFDRAERIAGVSPYEDVPELAYDASSPTCVAESSPHDEGALRGACGEATQRFVAAMDDDFNTGNAIAALFEFASAINRHIESGKLESGADDAARADLLGATRRLVGLGRLIGLFLEPPEKGGGDDALTDAVMQVLIEVRQHVRKNKDFATADMIRDRLKDRGITLEDRADGTIWRKE